MNSKIRFIFSFLLSTFFYLGNAQVANFTFTPPSGGCNNNVVNFSGTASNSTVATSFTFNGGALPAGWSSSPFTITSTFCPGKNTPDNSNYFWATNTATSGPNAGLRFVQTNAVNVALGGTISFLLRYAADEAPSAGCEDPDEPAEEVILQYSTNGGTSWTTIFDQWDTNFTFSLPWYNWYSVNLPIPAGAQTASTIFRWYQPSNSGDCCDNWGLEDVNISSASSITAVSYAWDFGDATTGNTENVTKTYPLPAAGTSATYNVTLTAVFSDASIDSETKTYVVNSTPATPTITASGSTVLCGSGSVTLTSSAATGNVWSNGATTPSITVSTAGNYTVRVTENGCPSATSAVTTVTIDPLPTVNAVVVQSVCNNTSTTAVNFTGAVAGTTYTWTNSNPSIGLAASGTGDIPSFTATNSTTAQTIGTITVTPSKAASVASVPTIQTFNYTGAVQTFTVPAGITSINIAALGAQGANGSDHQGGTGGSGGLGSSASGILAVTPGDVLNIYVGGAAVGQTGGFNGGGNGGNGGVVPKGGGGGGASDVRYNGTAPTNRVIVAAGGGGGGAAGNFTGYGGGIVNGGNFSANGSNSGSGGGGFGATSTTGGLAGIGCGGFLGTAGTNGNVNGTGGLGGSISTFFQTLGTVGGGAGAGGGGGYIGGGAGGAGSSGTATCGSNGTGGGGGGAMGTSYTGGVTTGVTTPNLQAGNGVVTITYSAPAVCTGTPILFNYIVKPTPAVSITGVNTICTGATTTLSPNTGGTWVSSNPSVATVTNTGVVTGLAVGTATFTYTDSGTGCISLPTGNVTVTPLPAAPTVLATQIYAGSGTVANLTATGTAIQWYSAATAGVLLPTTTSLVDGTIYYASQTVSGCESSRVAVKVRRISDATQTFCAPATVANLVSTPSASTTASWYSVATGGTVLANTAALSSGAYFVQEQTASPSSIVGSGFRFPYGVAIDASGNIFVVDTGNNCIKKMDANGNNIVTLASGFNTPLGIALDNAGNIYVADSQNNVIKKINPTGTVITTIGIGFNNPFGLTVDNAGNVYVADNDNNLVKKINSTYTATTTLGSGFVKPFGIDVDDVGNIYVTDFGSNSIKKMDSNGNNIITLAGPFPTFPRGLTVGPQGQIVFSIANGEIRGMDANGNNQIILGTQPEPTGLAFNSAGILHLASTSSSSVRKLDGYISNRVAVNVVVNPTPLAPTATAQQFLAAGSTIANLTAAGSGIQWYSALTGGAALANATPLVNGTTYFASQTVGICESTRIPVQVTITANNVAINFDGTNDFMRVPNNASINFTTNMTVEFWVRRNANTSNFNYIVGKANSGSWDNGYSVAFSGTDRIVFSPKGWTGSGRIFSNSTVDLNTWTHVAGTYDGATVKLYLNGILDSQVAATGAIPTNALDLFIGSDNGTGYFANCDIDMVRLWNTARTQTEIAGNLNNCISVSTAGLVAQYDFEEVAGSVAFQDTSGNSLHGSYNNMETPDWILGATCASTYVACAPLVFTNTTATNAILGSLYNLDASVSGNTQPVSYSITPALPTGLSIGTSTGIISGTPTAISASTTYTVTATSQGTCTVVQAYTFEVVCPILVFATATLPNRDYNQAYSQSVLISNPTSAVTYTISSGSLPLGFALSTTGNISGTSTEIGTSSFTVLATDANGCSTSQTFSISLSQIPITVTAIANTKVFGSTDPVLTYTVVPSLQPGDSFTGSLIRIAGENAGTYAINQGSLSSGPNYIITYVGADFTITKASQTITWNQDLVIGCDNLPTYALNATSTSGLPVDYISQDNSIATITGSTLNIINQGSVNVIATQSGNANFDAATNVIQTVVVSQSGLIRKHWRDVIFFDNSSNDYSGYQWYKNGVLVANANQQYFKENGNLSGTYYATAFKNGTLITTCTLVISDATPEFDIKVFPNPASAGGTFEVETTLPLPSLVNAKIEVYNQLSALLSQSAVTGSKTIVATPLAQGVYIVRLTLSNGNVYSVNLLVK